MLEFHVMVSERSHAMPGLNLRMSKDIPPQPAVIIGTLSIARPAGRGKLTSENAAPSHSSNTPLHSRGMICPRFARTFAPPRIEGAGNAGRLMRRSLGAERKKAPERSHHGHTGTTRHSPRNGFTAYFVLSPVTRLV